MATEVKTLRKGGFKTRNENASAVNYGIWRDMRERVCEEPAKGADELKQHRSEMQPGVIDQAIDRW